MGQAEEQTWMSILPKLGEPVFRSSYSSQISITTIEVKEENERNIEEFLTNMISEFWQSPGLKDIKVMKSHSRNEFVIIMSCDFLGVNYKSVPVNKAISVTEKLEPLVKSGNIRIIENKSDHYLIIE